MIAAFSHAIVSPLFSPHVVQISPSHMCFPMCYPSLFFCNGPLLWAISPSHAPLVGSHSHFTLLPLPSLLIIPSPRFGPSPLSLNTNTVLLLFVYIMPNQTFFPFLTNLLCLSIITICFPLFVSPYISIVVNLGSLFFICLIHYSN